MAQQPGSTNNDQPPRKLLIAVISIALICLLAGIGTWTVYRSHTQTANVATPQPRATATPTSVPTPTPTPSGLAGPVSPLIFGTNVAFFDKNDQVLNSTATQSVLQQMHPTIIRMPTRQDTLTLDLEIQMAKTIKSLGAVPLIILQGPHTPNPLNYDIGVIQAMNTVFGSGTVYYEFSNEEDYFHHTTAEQYVAAWNSMVPTFKQLAPTAQFIGPVTSSYNRDYLMTFLQQANPKPDEISWHEYTCDKSADAATCLGNIDHWTTHISDARTAMQTTLGKVYPIMITEWNYAPNPDPSDGKDGNAQFMTEWTTKALHTLAANRIYASMEYSATNTYMSLINNNDAYTPQGTVFHDQYEQMIVNKQQPPPVSMPGQ
ncbi:MAG TPA: hypothetical protein VGN34_10870 [Ktedonobacteraceae bacterium]